MNAAGGNKSTPLSFVDEFWQETKVKKAKKEKKKDKENFMLQYSTYVKATDY